MPNPDLSPAVAGTRDRLIVLDLMRFLAAIAVVAFHYLYRGSIEGGYLDVSFGPAGQLAALGYLGVNLFFMISGFVIIWSASNRGWYDFSVGRLARLYPAHVVAMTLTAILTALWATEPFTVSLAQWAANLTMLAPLLGQPFMDGAYWSIALEIVFYGWVALGLMTGILPRHTDRFVGSWLAIILVNATILKSGAVELLFVTKYGACFCFGIGLWRLVSAGPSLLRLVLLGVSLTLTFHTAEIQRVEILAAYGEAGSVTMVALANALILMLFAATVLAGSSPADRVSRCKTPIMILGGLSYPLYLVHQHAGYILINALAPFTGKWVAALTAFIVALAVAWLIFHHAEPLGRRVIRGAFSPLGRFLPGNGRVRAGLQPAE